MADGTHSTEFLHEITKGFETKMRASRERMDRDQQQIEDQLGDDNVITRLQQVRVELLLQLAAK